MGDIKKALQFMLDTANDDTHGYDQAQRNSPDYDCSSLVGTALNKAGFNVSPYSYTGNLRKQLLACGFVEISVNANRLPGDIFLTENQHVVMCVDSNTIVHASINEKGTARGGKTGDQTGKEICERSYYTPSYGWQYHFRYEGVKENDNKPVEVKASKPAKSFDRGLGGVYVVTATWLNVRNNAGVENTANFVLTTIPKGTKVTCYGYYTKIKGVKWLYVQFIYKGVKYTGFCSSTYLEN